MNVIDRRFSAQADAAKAERAARKRRFRVVLGIAAILIVAAVLYVVWAFTLCGDCTGIAGLSPPA
jgi:t-SNARE complex subunit (syntaxin)